MAGTFLPKARASHAHEHRWPWDVSSPASLARHAGPASIMSISWDLSSQAARASQASGPSWELGLFLLPGHARRASEHHEHQLGPFFPNSQGQPSIRSISWEWDLASQTASLARRRASEHHEHQLGPAFLPWQGQPSIRSISWELGLFFPNCQGTPRRASEHHEHQLGPFFPNCRASQASGASGEMGKLPGHATQGQRCILMHQLGPFFPSCQGSQAGPS